MTQEQFAGDKKVKMTTLLAPIERKFIDSNVKYVPAWLETYHLTMMTVLWSVGIVGFGWLAQHNIQWLWASSAMLFLQWLTDCFDGAVGRARDTGLIKWGYYMDHFLDYIFMACILIGYSFSLDGLSKDIVLWLIPVSGCFMINAFLSFAVTNQFKITYLMIGPTEARLGFIVLNALLVFFGIAWIKIILPYILVVAILAMIFIVFRTQKYIWNIDMQVKKEKSSP